MTLISELREWIRENHEELGSYFVTVVDKLPPRGDNQQDKGCVGLEKGHILLSFTVWDRRPFPVELLVYNTHIDKTVVMKDFELATTKDVIENLTATSKSIVSGRYDDLSPDPNISSS